MNDISAQIRRLEDLRITAMLNNDGVVLEGLLAEELIHIHSYGHIEDKRRYIDQLSSRNMRYIAYDRTDLEVKVFQDVTAVATSNVRIEGELYGKHKAFENRVVTTWMRFANGWKLIVSQSTPLPRAESGK
jgi:hypothetical protein